MRFEWKWKVVVDGQKRKERSNGSLYTERPLYHDEREERDRGRSLRRGIDDVLGMMSERGYDDAGGGVDMSSAERGVSVELGDCVYRSRAGGGKNSGELEAEHQLRI